MRRIRKRLLQAVAVVATMAASVPAAAFPDKPIDYIIPFGPGGESDITARHQQPFFKERFGQDIVISYKPGGGGAVGWAELNSYRGDGYTIMGINLPHIVVKPLQGNAGFQTDDLAAVYIFHYTPDAIVVSDDSPFKTLQDLIEYAKAQPGKLTFSGSGRGTANHLAQVTFDKLAQIRSFYVPMKGTGAAVEALLVGDVQAQWGYSSVGAKHGDKVRLLALATEERHPRFPDVPTFKELGFDIVSGAYRGIAVPQSTPEPLRRQLSDMIGAINADPEFKDRMEADGMALLNIGYGEIDAFLEEKTAHYVAAARAAGVLE